MTKQLTATALITAALAVAACGSDEATTEGPSRDLPQGSEPVKLNPADFTTKIDNPYWPMKPGNKWVYRETDSTGEKEKAVVTVTSTRCSGPPGSASR